MIVQVRACPECNWTKWKTMLRLGYVQCLHCYKKITLSKFKKIKEIK